MSGLYQLENNVPDTANKLIDEESCETIDSGFISGGNLLVSGEIPINSEELALEEEEEEEEEREDNYMRLDSGVDLSESFSSLSLKKDPNLNDLAKNKRPVDTSLTNSEEFPWKIYFQQNEDGDTPLHIAIIQGYVGSVLALIKLAPHPFLLDTPNDDAQTPIHLAVLTGQYQIVRWLIIAGVKPSPRDIQGDSPLHLATRRNDLKCCHAITDPIQEQERQHLMLTYSQQRYIPVNLEQWNYQGQTCVHVAALYGHTDILRHLIWCGADINAREGLSGYTALHYAIKHNNESLICFILTECKKLNPNTLTYGGRNALEINCSLPLNVIEILKSKGVESPFVSDNEDEDEVDSEDDSEHEMTYEANFYVPNLVNASA